MFISHAGEHKTKIAEPLYEVLKNHGLHLHPFLDKREIREGAYGPDTLNEAMETASCGIFILSPQFVAKEWPMKELKCFLRRRAENEERGIKAPILIPVFYRLTWEDCGRDTDSFFKKYKRQFQSKKYKFKERVERKEISQEEVMKALRQLKGYCGVVREAQEGDVQTVQKIVRALWNNRLENVSSAGSRRMLNLNQLDHLDCGSTTASSMHVTTQPDLQYYVPRPQLSQAIQDSLGKIDVCRLCGYGGSGKSALAAYFARGQRNNPVVRFVCAKTQETLMSAFLKIARELGLFPTLLYPKLRRKIFLG